MNLKEKLLSAASSVFMLISLAGLFAHAQRPPLADHHAHLQSATAARLLNEGAGHESQTLTGARKETPSTAAELIAQLDAAGIRRSVALSDAYRLGSPFVKVPREAAAVDAENEWTLLQVQLYPDRLLGFCSVNPLRPYALAVVKHCAAIGLRGGLKLHLANADFRFDDPGQVEQLRKVFAAADRLRMPILIHLRTSEAWHGRDNVRVFMERILPFASHIPVQVAHLGGWGGYDQATDDTLSAFATACEERPQRCRNLCFDISAVVLSPAYAKADPGSEERLLWDAQSNFADGPERLATGLRRIGLSRIIFGTDWPNVTASSYMALLRHSLRLSRAEIDQIYRNVAPYFRGRG